jgi:TonB family protein
MEAQSGAEEKKGQTVKTPPQVPDLHLHLLDAEVSEDVVSSYRRREAAWISLVTHGIIIALLLLVPKWTKNQPVIIPLKPTQNTIFVPLPDDQQKIKTPPKTDIMSDKNRVAQSNTPAVDKDFLRKLMNASKPGPPKAAEPPPASQQAAQQNPSTIAAPPQPAQPAPSTQTAQVQAPQPNRPKNPFKIASPGATVNQAVQSVASGHGTSGVEYGGGEYGNVVHPKTDHAREGMEILSDTLGVDFGPYMKRLHYTVQTHWDPLIPESALPPVMKKGVVVIEFSIDKNGKVSGMKLISSSGYVELDRAAWGAITDAIPLPQLPTQFAGEYLTIRAHFLYNPDKADMQ